MTSSYLVDVEETEFEFRSQYNSLSAGLSVCLQALALFTRKMTCDTLVNEMPLCAHWSPTFCCWSCFGGKREGKEKALRPMYTFFAKCTPNANYTGKLAEGHNLLHK